MSPRLGPRTDAPSSAPPGPSAVNVLPELVWPLIRIVPWKPCHRRSTSGAPTASKSSLWEASTSKTREKDAPTRSPRSSSTATSRPSVP
jgi:hypothetical protein